MFRPDGDECKTHAWDRHAGGIPAYTVTDDFVELFKITNRRSNTATKEAVASRFRRGVATEAARATAATENALRLEKEQQVAAAATGGSDAAASSDQPGASQEAPSSPQRQRMVAEKAAAAIEGSIALAGEIKKR
jgi:hypothetical protein